MSIVLFGLQLPGRRPPQAFLQARLMFLAGLVCCLIVAAAAADETPYQGGPVAGFVAIDAPGSPSTDPDDASVLEDLRRRIEELEAAQSKASQPKAEKKKSWREATHEKWTVKLGGHVFADYINWADASPSITGDQDLFNFRRIRLNISGTGYGVYDFRLQLDAEPDNDTTNGVDDPYVAMKDVYLGINELPWNSRVRFGNFFVPFSLEQLTPLPCTMFTERSIPATVFGPEREVGVADYHISDSKNATLAMGVFFSDIPESTKEVVDDNQGIRLGARGTWLPYYSEPTDGRCLIHTGAGIVYTQPRNDRARFRARPGELRETPRLIDTGFLDTDAFTVVNTEAAVVWGPLSVQSELFLNQVELTTGGDASLFGSYLQGSYFLTGEHRVYDREGRHLAHFGRVVPKTTLFLVPCGAGWGAWEAKARWSYLDFTDTGRGLYNDLTVGLNWYWHENARWVFEWLHPWTSSDTTFGETESDLLAIRMQFTW